MILSASIKKCWEVKGKVMQLNPFFVFSFESSKHNLWTKKASPQFYVQPGIYTDTIDEI